ncbi:MULTISPECIES: phenylacetate--CoA ligase family protein [Pigmentiphaga]|uniref:Phenylacetate--CoA ligase n=1 Tax=Pigmentiphaga daeguensis TaxID=414049 RepID=A0ABN1BHH0_9BURK|nr:phenylacetate--CoA ligase family protein [Pigmentiphaga sp. D-2]
MNAPAPTVPRYYESLDFPELWKEFPTASEYQDGVARMPAAELRALQERRFLAQVQRAWQIPFYQRHWSQAGLKPQHIRSLSDLAAIPPFSVHDLRDALARNPPWGDFMGIDPDRDPPMPLVMQTSGGTTGLPRPMLYSPRDREVMNILTGRRLHMQGVRPYDLVQVMLSLGLSNGGFLAREGIWKYTGAVPVMTGTGAVTPTRRQIEIMQTWKTTQLVAFPAYLRHIGLLLRDELHIDPRSLGIKGLIVHLGVDDREELEALWGAPVYDTYGTNECGSLAADCSERTGMHIFEDAFVLEIADPDTLRPVADGERGVILQTTLFKHFAPLIRFNSNDISSIVPGHCPCGGTHRRLSCIFGRADNMVKLRGTNVFPEAIGALVAEHPSSNGEYLCIVDQDATGRDHMTVLVETDLGGRERETMAAQLADRFKEALGVKLAVTTVAPGELDARTGLSSASKVRRLIDNRPKDKR